MLQIVEEALRFVKDSLHVAVFEDYLGELLDHLRVVSHKSLSCCHFFGQ